ncbi:hypothetical protein DXA74_09265 [Bacteroides sp. OF04-15BH]|nr:hypothetical protein DXA74_09265 [Bacteroides sp. OF04-15BH]
MLHADDGKDHFREANRLPRRHSENNLPNAYHDFQKKSLQIPEIITNFAINLHISIQIDTYNLFIYKHLKDSSRQQFL